MKFHKGCWMCRRREQAYEISKGDYGLTGICVAPLREPRKGYHGMNTHRMCIFSGKEVSSFFINPVDMFVQVQVLLDALRNALTEESR